MGGIKINENLDLTKILDGCPMWTKFYSTIHDEISFKRIQLSSDYPIVFDSDVVGGEVTLTKTGRALQGAGECIVFPSKDQRDWSKFERFWDNPKTEEPTVEIFDENTLQPFDKVLVRDYLNEDWMGDFFEKILEHDIDYNVACVTCKWTQCIPYNEETKHLLGTREDCPEYYKWWDVKQEKIAQNFLNKLKL